MPVKPGSILEARALDRRSGALLRDSITEVRTAMLIDAGGADWGPALDALAQLERRCDAALRASQRRGRGLTAVGGRPFMAIAGIDRLSSLREEFGQAVAPRIIDALGERILACTAEVHLGRINRSSIEFSFHAEGPEAAHQILSALQRSLESPVEVGERTVTLDVAIGYAGRDSDADGLEVVVDRAEHALAKARAAHAKLALFTEKDRSERMARLSLIRDLRTAAANGELFVCYQPKLSLRSGTIKAVEALVRWRHPLRGVVAPDLFIGIAEESEEIRPITEAVIDQALADRAALRERGHDLVFHVNISGNLIADADFAAWALARVEGAGRGLGFEITETAVIASPELALAHIRAFSAAGVSISIDDYGSGLSSLTYLKQIPAHELKIDKAFVSGLTSSHRDPLLVRSTIDLAHALEMEVTAEGVDNPMALALLKAMGCDVVQGYHIAKPLALADLAEFLETFAGQTTPVQERPAKAG